MIHHATCTVLWSTEQTSRCGGEVEGVPRYSSRREPARKTTANKVWLQQDTLELVEKKRLAFAHWQEDRLDQT